MRSESGARRTTGGMVRLYYDYSPWVRVVGCIGEVKKKSGVVVRIRSAWRC